MEEQAHEKESKLKNVRRVKKGLAERVSHKEVQMNEVETNQRKQDQRQREGSHRARNNELKNEGCEHGKKQKVKVRRRQKNTGM